MVDRPCRGPRCQPWAAHGLPPPTAMMQACGGLMTAVNSLMPNMPRFEIGKELPGTPRGELPLRARLASLQRIKLMAWGREGAWNRSRTGVSERVGGGS